MRRGLLAAALVALVAALGTLAVVLFAGGTPDPSDAKTYTADLERGAAIYAEACASCHGANLEGQPDWRSPDPDGRLPAPPHDETGHTWHHPDRLLLMITRDGTAAVVGNGYESNMPGFGDTYTDAELRDVLEWIKTRWPQRERSHQALVTADDRAAR